MRAMTTQFLERNIKVWHSRLALKKVL